MQLAKRYYIGEDITLIQFYYSQSGKKKYLTLNDLITQCINDRLLVTEVCFNAFPLTIRRELLYDDRAVGFVGDWMFSAENSHHLTGFNRLSSDESLGTFDASLCFTWEIIEYRIVKTRAYDAVDLRYARDFLKLHEAVVYPLIRRLDKQFMAR